MRLAGEKLTVLLAAAVMCCGCSRVISLGEIVPDGGDTDTGTDADTDTDTDADTDTDTDTDTDADSDECTWQIHASDSLNSVWGDSANEVFMVGGMSPIDSTVLHYNWGSWDQLETGMGAAGLTGVWGTGPSDVFVVCDVAFSLRYDGSEWDITSMFTAMLQGIWGASSDDVFAVGGSVGSPLVAHFDGSEWTEMSGIPLTNLLLNDVWGTSGSNVYAVGSGSIIHYDGASWSSESIVLASLYSIWGSSSSDIWAVGSELVGAPAVVYRRSGGSWNQVDIGAVGDGVILHGVWGNAPDNVYAVGSGGSGGVMLHFDGSEWGEVEGPFDFALNDVWVAQTGQVFAVGEEGTAMCLDE